MNFVVVVVETEGADMLNGIIAILVLILIKMICKGRQVEEKTTGEGGTRRLIEQQKQQQTLSEARNNKSQTSINNYYSSTRRDISLSKRCTVDVVIVVVNCEMPLKSVVVEQWTHPCAPNQKKLSSINNHCVCAVVLMLVYECVVVVFAIVVVAVVVGMPLC